MRNLVPHRFGSDPEFVFMDTASHAIIPASVLITANKAIGLKSFIGIDGHPATAELRPPPTNNVKHHLYYLAHGIKATNDFLRHSSTSETLLVAAPVVLNEALGGHIHVSLFANEPCTLLAQQMNVVYHVGQLRTYDKSKPGDLSSLDANLVSRMQEYVSKAAAGEATTPDLVCKVLNYIVLPAELWLQPRKGCRERMMKYQNSDTDLNYFVRWLHTTPANRSAGFNSWAYMHVEYRTPSTWLVSPWLAYLYLALVKLVMLNWEHFRKASLRSAPLDVTPEDNSSTFHAILMDRLHASGLTYTRDLRDLPKAIDICGTNRTRWHNALVDVAAWEDLLK